MKVTHMKDYEYTGNFTIKFYSKDELQMLQRFFDVRRSKFDMKLLEKRPELLKKLSEAKND